MKKLIAIAVVFALIASAAFAETAISGNVTVRGSLLSDTFNDTENTATISGEIETTYIQLSGTNDEGTFGGLFRMRGNDGTGKFHRAFAWWKPIPQLNIFFGQDPDGKFAPYNAWSFFQGEEGFANVHDWGQWRAPFPGNWDTFGLAFSLYPVDGLEVSIIVPLGGISTDNRQSYVIDAGADGVVNQGNLFNGQGDNADNINGQIVINDTKSWEGYFTARNFQDIFGGSLQLAASYAIPQIGKVFLNVLGPGQNIFADYNGKSINNYGTLGLSFLLTAVEGLDVQIGFSTTLAGEVKDYPSNLGLIANYTGGEWGVRFRSRLVLGTGAGNSYNKDYSQLGLDVQPWYNFGAFTAYLSIGFVSTDTGVSGADPVAQFVLNPYIRMGLGGGSIRFGVVFQDTNLDKDNDATIKIPLVFGYSF